MKSQALICKVLYEEGWGGSEICSKKICKLITKGEILRMLFQRGRLLTTKRQEVVVITEV